MIVDCAPTGETLRLLSFPDVVTWWLERILPSQRRLAPFARTLFDMPLPGEAVFDDVERLARNLVAMNGILRDRSRTSIRLVMSPDRMVVKEAMRTFTYLNLYGYLTDAVVVNRLLPRRGLLRRLARGRRRSSSTLVRSAFAPVPVLTAPYLRARGGGRRDARPAGRRGLRATATRPQLLHDRARAGAGDRQRPRDAARGRAVRRARRPQPEEDRARGDRARGRPEADDHAAARPRPPTPPRAPASRTARCEIHFEKARRWRAEEPRPGGEQRAGAEQRAGEQRPPDPGRAVRDARRNAPGGAARARGSARRT